MTLVRVWWAALACAACVACAAQARLTGPEAARDALCGAASDCTIDLLLQRGVEAELDRLAAEQGTRRAVIVVVEPTTGAVLAMGGREGKTSDPWLAATRAVDPGSVAKSFTIGAALETGAVDETTKVLGEGGKWRLGPQELLLDSTPRGELSVEDVLVFSSNIGTAKVARELGRAPLAQVHEVLQWNVATLPKMRAGHVPDVRRCDEATALRVSFGADFELTPLQLAASYGVFADEGRYRPPAFTRSGLKPARQLWSPATATRTQRLLAQTVGRDDGTGRQARLPNDVVAGKTGTAPLEEGFRYANFAGFVLEKDGPVRFVVLVGVETSADGSTGGTVAAPSAARVLSFARGPVPGAAK